MWLLENSLKRRDVFCLACMMDRKANSQPMVIPSETGRIREIFAQRKEPGGPFDLYGLYNLQERQEYLFRFFREIGLPSLRGLSILEIGCGSGGMLRRLADFGAEPSNCFGIDLFTPSLRLARHVNPNISFVEGNAAQLPFPDGQFDLVLQFTVFTSVLSEQIRRLIASEIVRAMRPGAHFVWYDFAYSNPRNPNVRGIGKGEIKELFPGCRLQFHKATLAPPIGRKVASVSPLLFRSLRMFSMLRTHYFCFIQKA